MSAQTVASRDALARSVPPMYRPLCLCGHLFYFHAIRSGSGECFSSSDNRRCGCTKATTA